MLRLFLLSMAFLGVVMVFILALVSLIGELVDTGVFDRTHWDVVIFDIPVVIIAGAGAITLGVMLVKRIIGLIKK